MNFQMADIGFSFSVFLTEVDTIPRPRRELGIHLTKMKALRQVLNQAPNDARVLGCN